MLETAADNASGVASVIVALKLPWQRDSFAQDLRDLAVATKKNCLHRGSAMKQLDVELWTLRRNRTLSAVLGGLGLHAVSLRRWMNLTTNGSISILILPIS